MEGLLQSYGIVKSVHPADVIPKMLIKIDYSQILLIPDHRTAINGRTGVFGLKSDTWGSIIFGLESDLHGRSHVRTGEDDIHVIYTIGIGVNSFHSYKGRTFHTTKSNGSLVIAGVITFENSELEFVIRSQGSNLIRVVVKTIRLDGESGCPV